MLVTASVVQMASGRAPELDGLPADFYKHFWGCLGAEVWEVLQECTRTGLLTTSCRNAVLSVILKTGDLALLKNSILVVLFCKNSPSLKSACKEAVELSGLGFPQRPIILCAG